MRTKIYLVRHGLTEWNEQGRLQGRLPGIYLSEQGAGQVEATAQLLRNVRIDQVITSPLERTVQTGEIINRYHQAPQTTDESFLEWQMDSWQGYFFDELSEEFPAEFKLWREDPSQHVDFGGESLTEVAARTYQGLLRCLKKYPGKNLLIVSHGDPIRALVAQILDVPLSNIRSFEIKNGGVTTLVCKNEQFVVESLNVTNPN